MADTLILNKDGTALSLMPLSVVSWQTAIRILMLGKVRVLKNHDTWVVRSPSTTMPVPSVVITTDYVKWNRHVKYNRTNIYLRDGFTCQYCKEEFPASALTLDHVVPRSHGGKSTWSNVVAACKDCNSAKGNNASIRPKVMPRKPSYYELAAKRRNYPLRIKDVFWLNFVDWPEELIHISTPTTKTEQ